MARGLKFRIEVVEGFNYPYSENKGADQLRGYREADLRLCFCICKNPVFSRRGSNILIILSIPTGFSGQRKQTQIRLIEVKSVQGLHILKSHFSVTKLSTNVVCRWNWDRIVVISVI